MRRRVVITGIGLLSPLGNSPDEAYEAAIHGRSGVIRFETEDLAGPAAIAPVHLEVERWFSRLQLAGVDRVSQLAVAAADLAQKDAGFQLPESGSGVYVGCGMGGAFSLDRGYAAHYRDKTRIHPLTVPAFIPNAPAGHIAMRNNIRGPVMTYSIACASAAIAIAEAARAVARGEIDCALAGGTEAVLVPSAIRAWQALQTLATPDPTDPSTSCRPFSKDRSGLVLGEGAAFLLVECLESAVARGARIYAEIAGSGISCDATHITKPDASGQVLAIQAALRDSGLKPAEVGYCNAHGTATLVGDVVECESLRRVWGEDLNKLFVSSTKSTHGHLLGAAGALEAAITVMTLFHQILPVNSHVTEQDPECAVNLVTTPNQAMPELEAAISNSFAFGGTNMVLAFRRYPQA